MTSVTVASYNIHWGRRQRGPHRNEPFDVVAACREIDTDLLALQEVWKPDGGVSVAQEVATALGYEVHEVWTARAIVSPKCQVVGRTGEPQGDGDWGQAILTRIPRSAVRDERLSGFVLDVTDRTVLRTEIELDGTAVAVCASHFPHIEHFSPLLRWRLPHVLPSPLQPAVLMGDFNMWRWLTRFVVPGWHDTVRGATWPSDHPYFQIDHLLATQPVRATETEVVHTGGSDHLPIRARLYLR